MVLGPNAMAAVEAVGEQRRWLIRLSPRSLAPAGTSPRKVTMRLIHSELISSGTSKCGASRPRLKTPRWSEQFDRRAIEESAAGGRSSYGDPSLPSDWLVENCVFVLAFPAILSKNSLSSPIVTVGVHSGAQVNVCL